MIFVKFVLKTDFCFFQYGCCLSHIHTDRTAHVITHYTKTSLDDLRKNIDVFADNNKNLKWIKAVGKDVLAKYDLEC